MLQLSFHRFFCEMATNHKENLNCGSPPRYFETKFTSLTETLLVLIKKRVTLYSCSSFKNRTNSKRSQNFRSIAILQVILAELQAKKILKFQCCITAHAICSTTMVFTNLLQKSTTYHGIMRILQQFLHLIIEVVL